GYILYSDRALYPLWGNLDRAIREGTNRWEQTFEGGSKALFDHHFSSEEQKRTFLAGMHGFGVISSPAVVSAFDLGSFRKLVDVGGATGHLVLAALDRYPQLEAAVFDLPGVVPVSREYLGGRAEAIGGDFFTDPLPPADLYSLGRILHDWGDEKCSLLLRRIYAALPAGGGVLIAEKLLAEDRTGPMSTIVQDLNMLVCTEGRERTASEYEAMLKTVGFSRVDAKWTGAPVDAILAIR
ncbi:MAG TPA: methyltransferase, partial [Bryobacteraceae bacterium]|nr:methyltransferase [Bryobacteraceae bacterium]